MVAILTLVLIVGLPGFTYTSLAITENSGYAVEGRNFQGVANILLWVFVALLAAIGFFAK